MTPQQDKAHVVYMLNLQINTIWHHSSKWYPARPWMVVVFGHSFRMVTTNIYICKK